MATFNATNPVTIGKATQKDHYDRVFDNTLALKQGDVAHDSLTVTGAAVLNGTLFAGAANNEFGGAAGSPTVTINGSTLGSPGIVFQQNGTARGFVYYDHADTRLVMSRIGAGTSGLEIDASDTAHFKASGQVAIGVNGADNKEGIHVIGSPTTSQSLGVKIDAGTNTSDSALLVRSQNGGTTYLNIRGDGAVAFTGMFGLAQATGPTIANGNNNNITISGVVNGLTAPSGNGDITGIAGGYEGRVLFLLVYSTLGGAVRLSNEDANSTAANRITIMAGGSAAAFNFAILVYNGATSRWRAYVIT